MGGRAEDALNRGRGSWAWLALLAAAIAVGAYLRFDRLGEPSYWLDEILHQHQTDFAAARPWWQWFGRLHEEHAGLYYLTQLVTRIFGRSEFAGRSASAFLGLATIPLLWLVPIERRARAAAVILLALSPLHIYYSREARGYALLLFLTTALIVILLRGRSIAAVCVVLLAMVYSSAVASTVVATAAAVSFSIAILDRERRRWYATAGACASIALVFFRVIYAARPLHDPTWPSFPAIDEAFLGTLARMFSVTALGANIAGRAAIAMAVLAVIGAVVSVRRDRVQGIVLIGMTVLPMAMTLVALHWFDHFFAVRYVIASLIGYLLLAGIGIAAIAMRAPAVLTVALTILLAAQGWSSARTEPFQKLDWRGIANALRQHVRPGDVILAAEPWSEVSLRYYLGEIPNVKLVYMAGVGIAEILVHDAPASWLVTAGASGDSSVRTWMCRYPVVLSSARESFRLHYAPSRRDLFQHRSNVHEQRAVSAALGDRGFTMRMDDDLLLGDGWANAEGSGDETFRWAVGRRATIVIPRFARRDHTIRMRAYPITPQTTRVSLNGKPLGTIALVDEWRDYTIHAPAAFWIDGLNTLAFEFEKSIVPSAHDSRELAASFRWISIDGGKPAPVIAMRISDEIFSLPSKTKFPPAQLRRDAVEPLLGRLGFDPVSGWARLTRGDIHLDDAAKTIAAGSDCEDESVFLDRAFDVLLEHAPDDVARRDLLQRMRKGASREQIVGRLLKSDEFRARMLIH